jgi:hypothetical protein
MTSLLYAKGHRAVSTSARDDPSAEHYNRPLAVGGLRYRRVQVVCDGQMFDRREGPNTILRSTAPEFSCNLKTFRRDLPCCECCNENLPPDAGDVVLCSPSNVPSVGTARSGPWAGAARTVRRADHLPSNGRQFNPAR